MKKLNPYIGFGGKCTEAMNFYKEVFGGELNIMTVGESPVCDHMPPEAKGSVMHSSLEGGSFTLMGTDMDGMTETPSEGRISICIDCESEEEIRRLFDALSAGGKVMSPLQDAFWGGLFGVTTDKYGISWMLNNSA